MGRTPSGKEARVLELVRAGVYEIDAEGRIWRVARRTTGGLRAVPRHRAEKASRPGSYLVVQVSIDGAVRTVMAHRIVFVHARGPIPPGLEINHINGRKDDNRPENLEAVTASENISHAHRLRLRDQRGESNPAAVLSDADVVAIRVLYLAGDHTMEQLAGLFGSSFQTIAKIVKGERRRTAGGPVASGDLRYVASDRDPETGRFRPPPEDLRVRELPTAGGTR